MERVDETAERVKRSVRDKVNQATGVVRGIRAVVLRCSAARAAATTARARLGGRCGTGCNRTVKNQSIQQQEVTWHTNTIGSNGKMVAAHF